MTESNLIISGKRSVLWLSFLQDDTLSYKELGLLGMLISAPKTQFITEQWLADQKTGGLSSVRSGLRELERKGFLERRPARHSSGRFMGNTWFVQLPKK